VFAGYEEFNEMSDFVCSPGEERPYNAVVHHRNIAAFTQTKYQQYYAGHPNPECYTWSKGWHEVQPGLRMEDYFTPPWADLVEQLASMLNGSVNENSLLGATAMEARATIRMLSNPYNLLKSDWRRIGKKLSLASLASKASNIWLETKYGWNAAKQDVKQIAETSKELFGPQAIQSLEEAMTRYSSSRVRAVPGDWEYLNCNAGMWDNRPRGLVGDAIAFGDGNCYRYKVNRKVRYGISCNQVAETADRWSRTKRFLDAWGFTPAKAFETLWEVIPYSFVVDWFVDPVGLWKIPSATARLTRVDVKRLGYSKLDEGQYFVHHAPTYAPYYGGAWAYISDFTPIGAGGIYECVPGRFRWYERHPGTPPTTDLVNSCFGKGLNLINGLSGLALSVQRLLH
jgi:hypothetical protein